MARCSARSVPDSIGHFATTRQNAIKRHVGRVIRFGSYGHLRQGRRSYRAELWKAKYTTLVLDRGKSMFGSHGLPLWFRHLRRETFPAAGCPDRPAHPRHPSLPAVCTPTAASTRFSSGTIMSTRRVNQIFALCCDNSGPPVRRRAKDPHVSHTPIQTARTQKSCRGACRPIPPPLREQPRSASRESHASALAGGSPCTLVTPHAGRRNRTAPARICDDTPCTQEIGPASCPACHACSPAHAA